MGCADNRNLVFVLAAIATAFVECAESDEQAEFLASMFVAVADSITLLQFNCEKNDTDPSASPASS